MPTLIHLPNFPKTARTLCALFALACCTAASADSVSGDFTLGKAALKPSHVAAFRIRDQFNPRVFETYVMLTTEPVDRKKISASMDPYTTAINDDAVRGDTDYLAISVASDGKTSMNAHVGGTQYVDSSGTIMGQRGSLLANCSVNTPERVACSVKVAKPVQALDGPAWTVDVQFDTAVLARDAGSPIAKDGGEAGKALLALVAAASGNDIKKIIALLSPENAEGAESEYNTPEENLTQLKGTLEYQLPKQSKITGGELINADTAVLEVEGVPYENGKMLYLVEMHKSEGSWKFSSMTAAGVLR